MSDAGTRTLQFRWRSARWLPAALVASLALNLAIIGVVGGAMWRHRPHPGPVSITPNLLGYANTLTPSRRKELWDLTANARQELRPFRREVRVERENVMKVMVTEPFDKESFKAAQLRLGEAETRARAAVQHLYSTIVTHLTPDERRGFKRWREFHRPPGSNLLDEPDQQANEPRQQR